MLETRYLGKAQRDSLLSDLTGYRQIDPLCLDT